MTEARRCQTCFHYNLADGMDRCRRHQHMRDGKIRTIMQPPALPGVGDNPKPPISVPGQVGDLIGATVL